MEETFFDLPFTIYHLPFTIKLKLMTPNSVDRITLIRGLGLIAAISIILGNVIGTGVFLKARVMTCNVGSPTWVIIAWIAA